MPERGFFEKLKKCGRQRRARIYETADDEGHQKHLNQFFKLYGGIR